MKTTTHLYKLAIVSLCLICHSPIYAGCTLTASITTYNSVLCYGLADGSATVTASGGTKPYTYLWSPSGQTTATATNLVSSPYTVTVTDSVGCVATASVYITQPARLNVVVTAISPPTCDTCCNGKARVTVGGGTLPYMGYWSNEEIWSLANDTILCAGNYDCCVTDANGCQSCDSFNIASPTGIKELSALKELIIYPNPSSGIFNFDLQGITDKTSIEIYNMLGEKVYAESIPQNTSNYPVSLKYEAKGIYLYRIVSQNNQPLATGKLIVE